MNLFLVVVVVVVVFFFNLLFFSNLEQFNMNYKAKVIEKVNVRLL